MPFKSNPWAWVPPTLCRAVHGSENLYQYSEYLHECQQAAVYMQGHRKSTHVSEIKIFHIPRHSDSSPGPGEMCECVRKDTQESIHKSNVLNSQHLKTSQISIKSRLGKKRSWYIIKMQYYTETKTNQSHTHHHNTCISNIPLSEKHPRSFVEHEIIFIEFKKQTMFPNNMTMPNTAVLYV